MTEEERAQIRAWCDAELERYRTMERPEQSVPCRYEDRLPSKSVRSTVLALLDELERVEAKRDLYARSLLVMTDECERVEAERDTFAGECEFHAGNYRALVGERDALRAALAELQEAVYLTTGIHADALVSCHLSSVGLPEGKP